MATVFRLENVTKVYKNDGKEFSALKGIDLDIEEGSVFGIIGMSGAGKSTLVRTLNRLEDVTSGSVKFYDQDLAELLPSQLRKIRRQIAMIFQSFNLLGQRTVLSNVMQPLKIAGIKGKEAKEKALEMLEVVGLADKKNQFPSRLSGGQRQRVAIARALASDPKVLLCDEATSALDPRMTGEILDLLKEINRRSGITILMITHELDAIRYSCNRMAVLEDGKITEAGNVREIFENPHSKTGDLFARVFMLMQNVDLTNGGGI